MNFQNSDAPQREVDKSKAKIRSLEAEHAKARAKYDKSLPAENDKSNMVDPISWPKRANTTTSLSYLVQLKYKKT